MAFTCTCTIGVAFVNHHVDDIVTVKVTGQLGRVQAIIHTRNRTRYKVRYSDGNAIYDDWFDADELTAQP